MGARFWRGLSRINAFAGQLADRLGLTRVRIGGWTVMSLAHHLVRLLVFAPYLKVKPKAMVDGFQLYLGDWRQFTPHYLSGEYEETLVRFLEVIREGDTVLDLGAHIGWFTLHAARAVGPAGWVYAFEPDPVNFRTLVANVEANRFQDRVVAVPSAVSAVTGTISIYRGASGSAGSSLYPTRDAGAGKFGVETVSLDEFFAQRGWPQVDVVKLDIEGAEKQALEGMRELILRNPGLRMIIEFDPGKQKAAGVDPLDLLETMQGLGFTRVSVASSGSRPTVRVPQDLPVLLEMSVGGAVDLLCERDAEERPGGSLPTDLSSTPRVSETAAAPGPMVSIVVTGYTEVRLQDIHDLLASVARQDYDRLEVIFVGEGSPVLCEKVAAHARSLGVRVTTLMNRRTPGLSGARNSGIEHVTGDIVAFVDDDVVLTPQWARALAQSFSDDRSKIGVTGAAIPLWRGKEMAWLPREFEWLVGCTGWFEGHPGQPVRNAWGANMAFRKEVFTHVIFDERMGGNRGAADGTKLGLVAEETAFSVKVRRATGGTIRYTPEVAVLHKVHGYRLTPRYVSRRAFWEGYTKALSAHNRWLDGVGPEHALVRRIALRLLPRIFVRLAWQPGVAFRQLGLSLTVLLFAGLGYLSARIQAIGRFTLRRFGDGAPQSEQGQQEPEPEGVLRA